MPAGHGIDFRQILPDRPDNVLIVVLAAALAFFSSMGVAQAQDTQLDEAARLPFEDEPSNDNKQNSSE